MSDEAYTPADRNARVRTASAPTKRSSILALGAVVAGTVLAVPVGVPMTTGPDLAQANTSSRMSRAPTSKGNATHTRHSISPDDRCPVFPVSAPRRGEP